MGERTRAVIVEDHALLAQAIVLALSSEDLDVVHICPSGEVGSVTDLLEPVLSLRPAVVLLDLDLGEFGDGMELIAPLRRAGTQVIVVTASTDRARWGECLAHGAATVLPKSVGLEGIARTIHDVVQGRPVISATTRGEMVSCWHEQLKDRQATLVRLEGLTTREAQVLAALARGRRVREIALDACVSEATVRTQVKSVLAKLGVTSQIAAVAIARDSGLVPRDEGTQGSPRTVTRLFAQLRGGQSRRSTGRSAGV
jgi:two-component system, NarL family, nitrate/nitrite response regulator NarL